jgi:FAD/FMN-containing dehydrogenase
MAAIRTNPAIQQLNDAVVGPVLTPDDPGFTEEASCFNASVLHQPEVIVGATSAEDVQAAVRWASENDMQVGVQATGHGATAPLEGGVLITTQRMQDLEIDPDTRLATMGAGMRWRRVIDEAAPHGLAPLNGSSSDAGAVGYTLGGGLAVLGRTYGFASDWVRACDVVTGEGELKRVSADTEPDLFWALRGGKTSAAIVTSMTVELLPIAEFYGGAIYYDGSNAPEILRTYAEWTRSLPDEMTTTLSLMRLPAMPDVPEPLQERFSVQLCVAYVGDAASGEELVRPMREVAPAIIDYVGMMPYTEIDRVHNDPPDPLPFDYAASVVSDLSGEVVDALLAEAGPGVDTPLLMVEIRHLGGAMENAANDAVGLRMSGYLVMTLAAVFPEIAAAIPSAIARAHEALAPFATGGSFVNLHGQVRSDEDKVRPWPGETATRLTGLKERFDPNGRFRFGHWQ